MRLLNISRCLSIITLLLLSVANANANADGFALAYEGLELVSEQNAEENSHPVLLSAPKRVNNSLRIEKQTHVKGIKYTYLYAVKSGYEIDSAADFYAELFQRSGSLEFECDSRNCGASNDWANKIFGMSVLAGRDNNQRYLAGTVAFGEVHGWLSVYAVTNGRREPFVLLSFIPTDSDDVIEHLKAGLLLSDSRFPAEYVIPVSDYLNKNPSATLYLVPFKNTPLRSFEENLQASNQFGELLLQDIEGRLKGASNPLLVRAMGSLGQKPLGVESDTWVYIYLVD